MDISTSMMRLGLNAIGRSGLARAVQPVFGGLGAILMFHHVGQRAPGYFGGNDHLSIRPEFLSQLLDEFRQECIDIVSLDEAVWRMRSAHATQPFVALTFDDGYRDNIETAYPILQFFRVPFTLFVCSGFVDREVPIWWLSLERIIQANNVIELRIGAEHHVLHTLGKFEKRRAFFDAVALLKKASDQEMLAAILDLAEATGHDAMALVDHEMATWDMLRALNEDPLVTIGAHTRSHPFLAKLPLDAAREEIAHGCQRIETMIQSRPEFLAYPYGFEGAVGQREVRLAEDLAFKAAFTTRKGLVSADHADHIWALPRVSINGHYQSMGAIRALLSGLPFFVANGFSRVKTL